jgi:hypothetical protein
MNWSSPHVYWSKWYIFVGHGPTHQKLRPPLLSSHRDHSNVNHISSSILLNICIKSLIHQSIAPRHYKNLQDKTGEKAKASYWASVHKKRKVSRKISSKPCKWVVWLGDVQACGCNDGQGYKGVTCGSLCRR